jgi:hypothetical protein
MPTATAAVASARMEPAAISAAVAAQVMEENASANVAVREETCRRRKCLAAKPELDRRMRGPDATLPALISRMSV